MKSLNFEKNRNFKLLTNIFSTIRKDSSKFDFLVLPGNEQLFQIRLNDNPFCVAKAISVQKFNSWKDIEPEILAADLGTSDFVETHKICSELFGDTKVVLLYLEKKTKVGIQK